MQLHLIENVWAENSITLQNEDGTIIKLEKHGSHITGEIDRSHTHDNRYKKWNTFGGFNISTPFSERIKEKYPLKEALWNFHFSYLGEENETLTTDDKLHYRSMAQMNLYHWLTHVMELPLPKEVNNIDKFYVVEGGEAFIKAFPTSADIASVNANNSSEFTQKVEDRVAHDTSEEGRKNSLTMICPTNNEDGMPTVQDFIDWYKELLFKAYTKWDFRYLYEPFVKTGRFECPFKGRTPEIQKIVASIA